MTPVLGRLSYSLISAESDYVLLTAGQTQTVEFTFSRVEADFRVEIMSQNTHFFMVEGNTSFSIATTFEDKNHTVTFVLKGVSLGIGTLTLKVENLDNSIPGDNLDSLTVKVRRKPTVVDTVYTYVLVAAIFVAYISMGVKMPWDEIWKRLRRPWGVIIGAICQFVVLPVFGFAMAHIANLDDVAAVGLIVIAACPGGYASNVITIMMDVDLVLSVTMTAVSSFFALGTMPLNLFLYGRQFTSGNDSLKTPYTNIIISLVLLLIPILIGILCYYKFPKVSKVLKTVLRPVSAFVIVLTLGMGIPVFIWAFDSPPEIYLVSIVLPVISATIGIVAAKLGCLDNKSAVTVAIETGMQNAILGIALAQISYPQPEADLIIRIPCLYFLFSFIEGSVVAIVYAIMKRFPGKPFSHDDSADSPQNDQALVGGTNLTAANEAKACEAEQP